jgi:hypothetical protein
MVEIDSNQDLAQALRQQTAKCFKLKVTVEINHASRSIQDL